MSSKKDEAQKSNKKNSLLVAIRIRGTVGLKPKIKYTLQSLRLLKRYNAILLWDDSEVVGMLRIAKDFITWGEIDEENIELMLEKRGRVEGNKKLTNQFVKEKLGSSSIGDLSKDLWNSKITFKRLWEAGLKPVFRLHPPKGGFRKTVKRSFKSEGELGYRGGDIGKLLTKMV